jgi:predicted nucleic acid-binding protein
LRTQRSATADGGIIAVMSDRVVLDANVLYPFSLRDTLLRLAEMELYDCLWSAQILEEATRNLVKDRRISSEGAGRLAGAMNAAFEDAQVDAEAIAALEGSMTNDAKDRHVLAAAVAGEASSLVTQNLKHFPASAATPFGITVVSPDEFLCSLYAIESQAVLVCLRAQAAALRNHSWTVQDLLAALERTGATRFVASVRADASRRTP